jgi:hypothetical protein
MRANLIFAGLSAAPLLLAIGAYALTAWRRDRSAARDRLAMTADLVRSGYPLDTDFHASNGSFQ